MASTPDRFRCAECQSAHAFGEPCGTVISANALDGGALPPPIRLEDIHPPLASLVGQTLGDFRILRELGRGGMGTVYLAEHTLIGSRVAIKLLHPELASNRDLVARFFAEARAVNLIGHENVVSIFDMRWLSPHGYFLVMEYLEGVPLSDAVRGPMPADRALPILEQTCRALEAAHAHGIVHRDLKPENLFLIRRGGQSDFVKVLDFGVAKLSTFYSNRPGTAAGVLVGTPEFMAPEQLAAAPVDGRADVYALGVISYLLATGRLPYLGRGIPEILMAHAAGKPTPPEKLVSGLQRTWTELTLRALEKDPEQRFPTVAEMGEAIRKAIAELKRPTSPNLGTSPGLATTGNARVLLSRGAPFEARFEGLSAGGLFVCTEDAPPPLLAAVKLVLSLPGGDLTVDAEVVRQVDAAQARAWRMSPGFGVQFVRVPPDFRQRWAALSQPAVRSAPAAAGPGGSPRASNAKDEAEIEEQLQLWRRRLSGNAYQVLGVTMEAEFSEIRRKARQALEGLEKLRERPLNVKQRGQLEAAIDRVNGALYALGTPARRADTDAALGNPRGIARCLGAGLTVTDLEASRRRHLADHRTHEANALVHAKSAQAWAAAGDLAQARAAMERALSLDPCNLTYHQRYEAIRARDLREARPGEAR